MLYIEKYKDLLENAIGYYFGDNISLKYFNRIPKSRYHTFKYCIEHIIKNDLKVIVELGTSRSFVDGRFEGCNNDDIKYWKNDDSSYWDWSAGCFTKVFSKSFEDNKNVEIHTVDLIPNHINRCKYMNKDANNIKYYVSSSEDFLQNYKGKIDLLYLDTGDMTPIEPTAQLHLREAKIIIENDLLSENGIILIDDIRSCVPPSNGETMNLGKGYLSIPYFIENGFEIIMDEYQMILKKIKK